MSPISEVHSNDWASHSLQIERGNKPWYGPVLLTLQVPSMFGLLFDSDKPALWFEAPSVVYDLFYFLFVNFL